jgi:hypothetical protein
MLRDVPQGQSLKGISSRTFDYFDRRARSFGYAGAAGLAPPYNARNFVSKGVTLHIPSRATSGVVEKQARKSISGVHFSVTENWVQTRIRHLLPYVLRDCFELCHMT